MNIPIPDINIRSLTLLSFLLVLGVLVVSSCSRAKPEVMISPSGAYLAATEISGEEAGPARRFCVRLRIVDLATKKEALFQTGASDIQTWAISWSPKNILILNSSDVGTYAYEMRNGKVVERLATAEEVEVGRSAHEKKYGTKQ